ncbi:unnamed protein product [Cylicostephanus goldi]|uniref:YxeA family protein n=1 Tax=Cylicostephanus goldi TaxID=71465 RepID=A0A3P6TAN1_CYLGO|nr:unnamed protein product [Cylicostephanus goldi]
MVGGRCMKQGVKKGALGLAVCAGIVGSLLWLIGPRFLLRATAQDAYVKINAPGVSSPEKDSEGNVHEYYVHTLTAVFKDKTTKTLTVGSANRGRPLRTGAYLLLKVNSRNDVESFEEVLRKDIPSDIADMLDKQPNTITS